MNLSAPFIKRPIGTTLLALGVAIAGVIAFKLLPVASLPQLDFPTISVQAALPGASPDTMATSVATPLERQLGRIAGITQMTSSSALGSTTIAIQFDLDRNINGAARDVQAAINAARSQLPANLPSNPTYRKINPADAPVMLIALTSPTLNPGQLYDIASTMLQQKLSQINGVGQVFVGGSSLPGVRVELNPTALNQYGIGLEQVRAAITANNLNPPKGQLQNGVTHSDIVTNDQLFKAVDYKPLIIAYRNDAPVRLSDVGNVVDSVENIRTAGLADGKPGVMLVITKQPGANVIATVNRVRAALPVLKASIPASIDMTIIMDRTATIRSSLHDVEFTLLVAIALVILVTYMFLGSVRTALIPTVAVSLSLLGTFGIMYLLGFSLDNLSLMALTISTGFVVDDAVVVLENTSRHIEAGVAPVAAALQGASEVGFTVLSMSTSLIAAFIPILFMGGIVGRLFREFALTLSAAILVSLIVSLTVTPMMCARLLQPRAQNPKPPSRLARWIKKMYHHYKRSLRWSLRHAPVMLGLTFGAIALTFYLFTIVPKGFFPQEDTGRIVGAIVAEQDISFQAMRQKFFTYIRIIRADPAVQHVVGFVGTNAGVVYITLKPPNERKMSSDEVLAHLRPELAKVPGAALYLQVVQELLVGARLGNAQFQYTLSADSLKNLNTWVPRVLAKIRDLPGMADANSDQLNNGLQSFITYDRDTASRFGITSQLLNNTLYDAFGQRQVSVMYTTLNQYHVVMEVAPKYWQRPEALQNIYVTSDQGNQVPLAAIAHWASSSTLLVVNHQNQFPSATISFNLLPGVPLGNVVSEVNHAVSTLRLPPNVIGAFQGTAQAFQASLATVPYLTMVALAAIYIVLGILYESTLHPITILSTLPSAGVGALLALLITHSDLSIIALIGILLLIGIVKKNAIMMIDFAIDAERTSRKSAEHAIYKAGILRFRPIMMTTLAAMFGAFPLAFGFGVGAELRRPLGIAIIGGLLVSQMLTLYTTPVIYLTLDRSGEWFRTQWLQLKAWVKPTPPTAE